MKISIYGAGYVGLVTATCLANLGHQVVCIDTDQDKIEQLQQGIPTIYELGLEVLLQQTLETGTLEFTCNPITAINHGEVQIIAVGTPLNERQDINLDYVYEVSTTIAQHLQHPCTLVLKSTAPPGTAQALTQHVNNLLQRRHADLQIDVASNPEFLQEGSAIEQFMHPDRIIVGAENMLSIQRLHDLYQPLLKNKDQFLITDKASAELIKYASNAFLATKLSFINEISQIAEATDANIHAVKRGLGLDYRINPLFLNAGCGFGGSCFPKDLQTLINTAKKYRVNPYVLEAVKQRNAIQQASLFHKVREFFQGDLSDKTIALWGLTFKPNTDDVRCATSHKLCELFWQAGCHIKAFDPLGMENFAAYYPNATNLELCDSSLDAVDFADVLVIATEWNQFRQVPLIELRKRLRYPAIFDGRNLFAREEAAQVGLLHYGIGFAAPKIMQDEVITV